MVPRSTLVVLVACWLVLSTPLAAVGGAQTADTTANGSVDGGPVDGGSSAGSDAAGSGFDACFPGEGYEFTIGSEGPEIRMVLHLSLLTNLGGPGGIGVELAGSINGPPIIELKTGVVFEGIDDVGSFLNNPFEPFGIVFDYRFELPMFGPSYDYEDSDAPIEGPIGDANCTVGE